MVVAVISAGNTSRVTVTIIVTLSVCVPIVDMYPLLTGLPWLATMLHSQYTAMHSEYSACPLQLLNF